MRQRRFQPALDSLDTKIVPSGDLVADVGDPAPAPVVDPVIDMVDDTAPVVTPMDPVLFGWPPDDFYPVVTPMDPTLLGWPPDPPTPLNPTLVDAVGAVVGTVADSLVTGFFDATTGGWYSTLGGSDTPVTNP